MSKRLKYEMNVCSCSKTPRLNALIQNQINLSLKGPWVSFSFTILLFFTPPPPLFLPSTDISHHYTTRLAPSWVTGLCFHRAFHNPPTAVSRQPHGCSLPHPSPVILREGRGHKQICSCTRQQQFTLTERNFWNIFLLAFCKQHSERGSLPLKGNLQTAIFSENREDKVSAAGDVRSSLLRSRLLHIALSTTAGIIYWSVGVYFITCHLPSS